ncbi:MAG TPA: class I SAM-dependent methyltransferase, partial [Verrucomicrobiae bacterium]|nr:class I SAM-dependent methyltransferase [Verrucomicrobiae bacterium]
MNSRELRTRRFDTDWVSGDGKYHRALFAGVELCCFPGWLTGDIEKKQFSICDWGCTLGVGTHALQSRFPGSRITGVDFSAPVVEGAKEAYPQIQFVQQELGAASGNARYDVLFSANTLEHFSNPWEVLEGLSGFVNHHLVIQVPYREMVRDEEHLYSFT